MAVNAQTKAPINIDTPNSTWSVLFYDDVERRWGFKKDDGTVLYFAEVGSETLTSLALSTNILTYTDELGNDTNIDLSLYLDDTNLARLVSGTINPSTGIATFVRDDASNFTVDFSSLIDFETVTTFTESPAGVFTYTSEDSTATVIDLSNFETSTQLDARDVLNRKRANHTGTQPANTITGLGATAISNNHSDLNLDDGSNPHGTTKADVGLGNVDNTSDINKPVSTATQNALDLKYDANNPAGYETPAQLNARDTANRDRSNHTSTQLAITISDIQSTITNNASVVANTAKVSNATHTGEVLGATSLALDPTAISNKSLKATPSGSEEVLVNDSGTLKKTTTQAIADLASGGGTQVIACCNFGANFNDHGNFAAVNGRPSVNDEASGHKTRNIIIVDGTLTKLAYQSRDADNNTVMKIHVNGVVEDTLTLTPDGDNNGVEAISISVSAGDYIELEFDAGDDPRESNWYFLQELS